MNEIALSGTSLLCGIASNPVPEGAHAGYFETSDKVRLRYAIWPKTHGAPKGTICLIHGRTEFIEKYFETIADLRRRGFTVATFDWRGQGGSDRLITNTRLGYIGRFDDYWTDLKSFHTDILLPECPRPFYLVGHSMGGLVALLAAARDRLMFDRMLLSAPMLAIPGQLLSMAGMATLAELLGLMGLGRVPIGRKGDRTPTDESFPGNPLTSDFGRYMRTVDTFVNRPDLEVGPPTLRWLASSFRAMARALHPDFAAQVRIPVLMLAAARDEVVSTPAIEHLGLSMRMGRHAVIPAARHELFLENDAVRAQVFAAFDAFITEQSD